MKIIANDLDFDVIGFGALNLDKLYSVDTIAGIDEESFIKSHVESPGGSAANTIIGLATLGLRTSYIGKIAEDDSGDALELNLAYNEVFTNNLIYSDIGKTGEVLGFIDSEGNRTLYVDPGVNDDIVSSDINPKNVNKAKIIHYSSFVGDSFNVQKDLIDKLSKDILLSFDPGMIYVKKGINDLEKILNRTNILLINEKELKILFNDEKFSIKELALNLLNIGIDTVIVKKGQNGVFALSNNEEVEVKSFDVDVVDTTGAGDAFNSGFLYSYLNDFSLKKSCTISNWIASQYIQHHGNKGFPSKDDLNDFIKNNL